MKHYLIINKTSPFSDYKAQEGIELAIALASFEQKVTLLFIQDGCWQLLKNCNNKLATRKDFISNLKALELCGIEDVYINTNDCTLRNPNAADFIANVTKINNTKQQQIISSADIVLNVG